MTKDSPEFTRNLHEKCQAPIPSAENPNELADRIADHVQMLANTKMQMSLTVWDAISRDLLDGVAMLRSTTPYEGLGKLADRLDEEAPRHANLWPLLKDAASALRAAARPALPTREEIAKLRDECLHEANKTADCYTCYTDQAARIARRLTAILSLTGETGK